MYSKSDLTQAGFRIARNIANDIQRESSIHPELKKHFAKSNIQLKELNEEHFEINLNSPLDNQILVESLQRKYPKDMEHIKNIAMNNIKKSGMDFYFELSEDAVGSEMFTFRDSIKDRFCVLNIKSSDFYISEAINQDLANEVQTNKKENHSGPFGTQEYYLEPDDHAEATTKDLYEEIAKGNPENIVKNIFTSNFKAGRKNSSDSDDLVLESTVTFIPLI